MLLWLSFACLSAVVLVALLSPLLRRGVTTLEPMAADHAVYRDQLAEIDADLARGLIGMAEAQAARNELSRRLLEQASASATESAPSPARSPASGFVGYPVVVIGLALVPAAALMLYQVTGAPGLPSRPYHARAAAPVERNSVEELIARVEARLREQPDDGPGWEVIAPVYLRQERFREASDAFANVIRLLGPNVKRLAGYAEATVIANNGIVSEDAKSAYEQILKLDAGHVEARFWIAMAKEQDGALEAAAADYRAMLAEAPPTAPWRAAVAERLEGLTLKLGTSGGTAKDAERGRGAAPDTAAAANLQRLSPEERMQTIAAMVDGLAERLKKDGADLDGWLRLLRAYKVLGRSEAAAAALADARKALQGNADALSEIEALAKSLGLGA